MTSIEESVVSAMDGSDKEIFPFLPYILQDIWEIGSDPIVIIELIRQYARNFSDIRILDLGCGKGAVSIKLAKELNCSCLGIDAINDFIEEADKKALEYGVTHLCSFEVGDIRIKVKELSGFDIIILGSIGPVFGNYYETLTFLSSCLNKNGIIIIDDGYIEQDSDYTHPLILKKEEITSQIKASGMSLIDEAIIQKDKIKSSDDYIYKKLKLRCNELIEKYPDKKFLFENYIKKQEEENDVLENKVICSTMVIKMGY